MARTRGRVVGGSRLDGGVEEMEAAESCAVDVVVLVRERRGYGACGAGV